MNWRYIFPVFVVVVFQWLTRKVGKQQNSDFLKPLYGVSFLNEEALQGITKENVKRSVSMTSTGQQYL
jgi:hypothetical protein